MRSSAGRATVQCTGISLHSAHTGPIEGRRRLHYCCLLHDRRMLRGGGGGGEPNLFVSSEPLG